MNTEECVTNSAATDLTMLMSSQWLNLCVQVNELALKWTSWQLLTCPTQLVEQKTPVVTNTETRTRNSTFCNRNITQTELHEVNFENNFN